MLSPNNHQDYALAGNNSEEDLSPKELEVVLGLAIASLADAQKELVFRSYKG